MKKDKQIDNIILYRRNDKLHLHIVGWFQDADADKTVTLYVDGKEMPCDVDYTKRQDVVDRYKLKTDSDDIGFSAKTDLADYKNIKSIKLLVGNNAPKEVISMNNKDIIYSLEDQKIKYNIDTVIDKIDEDGKMFFEIEGWAVSNEYDKLEINLTDEKGSVLEYELEIVDREDLMLLGCTENPKSAKGFSIKIYRDDAKLCLKISSPDGKISEDVNINKIFQKYRRKLHRVILVRIIRSINGGKIVKCWKYFIRHGFKGMKQMIIDSAMVPVNLLAAVYPEWFEKHRAKEKDLEYQRRQKFEYSPKVSILVPTYNTPIDFLHEMIDSVVAQSYENWELCIADGSGGNTELENVLKEYNSQDARIVYKILDENKGISGNTNGALELATGDVIGLLDHDDLLEPDLLYEVVKAFQNVDTDIVYTDEDKILAPDWQNVDPNFKPDFSIDLFRSHNYITHFFAVKKSLVDKVGGFRSEFDGSQDYDFMFRCIEIAKGIHHVPKILYHWRMCEGSTAADPKSKMYCYEAGKHAIEEHLKRVGLKGTVTITKMWGMYHTVYQVEGNPLVSIVIANKDHIEDLDKCIRSIETKSTYRNFEFVVVENNSTEQKTFTYYDNIQKEYDNVKVVYWDKKFNYSTINNYGVKHSKGEYILLLNNDTELITPTAIEEMLGICMRDDVGIVGAKLLYADNTVQHAGVVVGFGGYAGHVNFAIGRNDYGYMNRARINCNYSAVTAACLLTKKSVFDEVGGLTEAFEVACNDVDYCLKVRKKGYLVVYNAFSEWHHYESKSRGYEDTSEKIERFNKEKELFQQRWPEILANGDPYYNINFPFSVDPFMVKMDD